MTFKPSACDVDHIVKEYRSGRTAQDIGSEFGISQKPILRVLRDRDIEVRPNRGTNRIHIPIGKITELFNAGFGVKTVASRLGCTGPAIRRIMRDNGVATRGQREQALARSARMTPAEKASIGRRLSAYVLGTTRSEKTKAARAATMERDPSRQNVSADELKLIAYLRRFGCDVIPQKAIGPYNCDLSVGRVAVEVVGGKWHLYGERAVLSEKRTRYILDAGWHMIFVYINRRDFPFVIGIGDNVIAMLKKLGREKTSVRQYRVIWGTRKLTTGGCADDDKICFDPPFRSTRDRVTGQYKTVPR